MTNVSDSRSILVYDKGDNQQQGILPLSRDHKPDIEGEWIISKRGFVYKIWDSYGNKLGPQRIWKAGFNYSGLSISRSLGDFHAKKCGVISCPEIFEYILTKSDKYLVICSHGVLEFIQNEQVRDLGNAFFNKNSDIGGFCDELVKLVVHSWEQFGIIRNDFTVVCIYINSNLF